MAVSTRSKHHANGSSNMRRLKFAVLWIGIPYVMGCLLSKLIVPEDMVRKLMEPALVSLLVWGGGFKGTDSAGSSNSSTSSNKVRMLLANRECDRRLNKILSQAGAAAVVPEGDDPFHGMSIVLHRNGEATPCGDTGESSMYSAVRQAYYEMYFQPLQGESDAQPQCPSSLNKYQVESLLTKAIHSLIDNEHSNCFSVEKEGKKKNGFYGFCDRGPEKTPILLDHNDLVPVAMGKINKTSLPCRFHTRLGVRIVHLNQLVQLAATTTSTATTTCSQSTDKEDASSTEVCANHQNDAILSSRPELHLYAVPAGRVFMFAPSHVGELFELPHVAGSDGQTIYLEVISVSPRVFDVFHFFSKDESAELVARAIAETSESHRIKRSSTGASGYNLNARRTSESGFDTHGKTAVKVKKRCFEALGFDDYWESHGDGLQILRYNQTTAYISHLDWIEDKSGQLEHDFDSGGKGGNRFATILLYMSDLEPEAGGETVFPKGWPPGVAEEDRMDPKTALEQFRASAQGNVLVRGSWEEEMLTKCRTRLAIRPHSSRAVLFYSQLPNGEPDPASLHGACPILSGIKFAANLWVWNTPRQGYPGAPMNEKFLSKTNGKQAMSSPSTNFKQMVAHFTNSGNDPTMKNAELYFEGKLWGELGFGSETLGANTYKGHQWNIRVDGKVVKSWTIKEEDGETQNYLI